MRIFLGVMTALASMRSVLDPESFSARIAGITGEGVKIALIVMGVLAVLAVADAIINDVLNPQWRYSFGVRQRHMLWGLIGLIYAAMAFLVVKQDLNPWAATTFVFFGFGCMAVAFLDQKYRNSGGQK